MILDHTYYRVIEAKSGYDVIFAATREKIHKSTLTRSEVSDTICEDIKRRSVAAFVVNPIRIKLLEQIKERKRKEKEERQKS